MGTLEDGTLTKNGLMFSASAFILPNATFPPGGKVTFSGVSFPGPPVSQSMATGVATVSEIPEPGTFWLFGTGVIGLLAVIAQHRLKFGTQIRVSS
jgi:threonine dehydrogenase-like Zn-dependent dehydrogenase